MTIRQEVRIPASAGREYPVLVGAGALDYLSEESVGKYSKIFVVTDDTVAPLWLNAVMERVPEASSIIVGSGERYKSIAELEKIWSALLSGGADRNSLVVNLGGGVIGDMGGFAAATYMRGIDFIQVPSTLLAQVDASVGGKLAVDFSGGKNCIGVFCQPEAVIADTATLQTLPERELVSGYAEVLKHGLICDSAYFDHCSADAVSTLSSEALADIVLGSVRIKADVVERDEREGGLRKILNFGHTVGHALESLSLEGMGAAPLLHGEAIALGMIAEAALSVNGAELPEADFEKIKEAFALQGFAVSCSGDWDVSAVMERMKIDKKNRAGVIRWTLLRAIGESVFDQEIEEEIVKQTIIDSIGVG